MKSVSKLLHLIFCRSKKVNKFKHPAEHYTDNGFYTYDVYTCLECNKAWVKRNFERT